ncbi:MAG: tRNA (guanine(37)-N(1))-methyltransferase, partial [Deferribacterales bacterium]|nr:tRNA (guanine(37)-N(1))-methyltransferase [Deferribacterales bacterium]
MKTYNIITIFPEMVESAFKQGVVSKGVDKGILQINPVNLRDFAEGKHQITDDYQYGGGAGLVIKPEPLCEAVKHIRTKETTLVVLLDP